MTKERDQLNLLIVDDDDTSLENLRLAFKGKYILHKAFSYESAIDKIKNVNIDLAVIDIVLQDKSGLEILEFINENKCDIASTIITGYCNENLILSAAQSRAWYLLKKPFNNEELISVVQKSADFVLLKYENEKLKERLIKENTILKNELDSTFKQNYKIIGNSKNLINVLERASKIAKYNVNTLIHGETGTGKELLARFIHQSSSRAAKPFIAVNCAALSPNLFESELFGYKKGAFTNANESRAGLFEIANGGFLFLDEITEIPLEMQAKLLRVVEDQKLRRIGDLEWIQIDITILSSTNRKIEKMISQNIFREDLYHRLASTQLSLPPLRERIEDLEELSNYFSILFANKSIPIPEEIMYFLREFEWPGNIRQFSNFMKNWSIFGKEADLTEVKSWLNNGNSRNENSAEFKFKELNIQELERAKEWMVFKVLKKYNGNKSKTAEHLGLSYPGLLKMLKHFE